MSRHEIESDVSGVVSQVALAAGDSLGEGALIVLLESMKMEIPINAPMAGMLIELRVREGEIVGEGQILAVLET